MKRKGGAKSSPFGGSCGKDAYCSRRMGRLVSSADSQKEESGTQIIRFHRGKIVPFIIKKNQKKEGKDD